MNHNDKMNGVQFEKNTTAIMGFVDTVNIWTQSQESERKFDYYHPSAFGKCLRQMQYQRYASMGLIEMSHVVFDARMLRLFGKGHNMHDRWVKYFQQAGVLRGYWKCKNPVCKMYDDKGLYTGDDSLFEELIATNDSRIYGLNEKLGVFEPDKCVCGCKRFEYLELVVESKELNMKGHADIVLDFSKFDVSKFGEISLLFDVNNLPTGQVVVDMKTANDWRFKSLSRSGPSLDYRIQLTIYANLLDCDYGLLIYENKNTSHTSAFSIQKNEDTVFAEIKQQALRMNEMVPHHLLPPPRPLTKDSYECKQCPFSALCHKKDIWTDVELTSKRTKFYGSLL